MKQEARWPTVVRFTEEDYDMWRAIGSREHTADNRWFASFSGSLFFMLLGSMACDAMNLPGMIIVVILGGSAYIATSEHRHKEHVAQTRKERRELLARYGVEEGYVIVIRKGEQDAPPHG